MNETPFHPARARACASFPPRHDVKSWCSRFHLYLDSIATMVLSMIVKLYAVVVYIVVVW